MADIEKIDLLVQYAISAAAREEYPDNQLGQIHVLKYVYLGDLAHAEKCGETFTGVRWQFYQFGPWSPLVHERIEPAVSAGGLEKMELNGQHGEFVRYRTRNLNLRDDIEHRLPLIVSRTIDKAIRKHGSSTPHLLEAVYLTKPMRLAAPGEFLMFEKSDQSLLRNRSVLQYSQQNSRKTASKS